MVAQTGLFVTLLLLYINHKVWLLDWARGLGWMHTIMDATCGTGRAIFYFVHKI